MRACCLTVVLLTCSVVLHADNWPQWRGPSGIGVTAETGLPERWGEGQAVAWRARLDGMGVSTPVVWGDQVIATSQIAPITRLATISVRANALRLAQDWAQACAGGALLARSRLPSTPVMAGNARINIS